MIGYYLSNNNEMCYNNFSPQNRELNGALTYQILNIFMHAIHGTSSAASTFTLLLKIGHKIAIGLVLSLQSKLNAK